MGIYSMKQCVSEGVAGTSTMTEKNILTENTLWGAGIMVLIDSYLRVAALAYLRTQP